MCDKSKITTTQLSAARALSKRDISYPENFKHVQHVGRDPGNGLFSFSNVDPGIVKFFEDSGISLDRLREDNSTGSSSSSSSSSHQINDNAIYETIDRLKTLERSLRSGTSSTANDGLPVPKIWILPSDPPTATSLSNLATDTSMSGTSTLRRPSMLTPTAPTLTATTSSSSCLSMISSTCSTSSLSTLTDNCQQQQQQLPVPTIDDLMREIDSLKSRLLLYSLRSSSSSAKRSDNCRSIFAEKFQLLDRIGSGSYGQVYKVVDRLDEQIYAVKRIQTDKTNDYRELKTMAKLQSDYCIDYKTYWIDSTGSYLNIQMKYYRHNLRDVISGKNNWLLEKVSATDTNDTNVDNIGNLREFTETFDYMISTEIFRELLSGLHYLHTLPEPVIHRDLKPSNIMFDCRTRSGIYCKIADFGLSLTATATAPAAVVETVVPESTVLYHRGGAGTLRYMAREVFDGRYSTKSDIYSLGIIAMDLFNFDNDNTVISSGKLLFKQKRLIIRKLVNQMIHPMHTNRPSTGVMSSIRNWCLTKSDLNNNCEHNTDGMSFDDYIRQQYETITEDNNYNDYNNSNIDCNYNNNNNNNVFKCLAQFYWEKKKCLI
ncbi:interferon-induced, double-stranded RNA-activated protein kinase-like [Oppia nitens]|uniref:interferon-induced, double-stranded RNA-activated protein kinase-like n=1 Tax=Oppia nitens TaxID=1686743 RepID=UPI0023DA7156|nr:interferon-induced, double-stranded RNA-activated protein kinase-like [Oppia nitens]